MCVIFRFKEDDANRLQEEYENMLKGLRKASEEKDADMVLANPILPDDILKGLFWLLFPINPTFHFNYLCSQSSPNFFRFLTFSLFSFYFSLIFRCRSRQHTNGGPLPQLYEALGRIHKNTFACSTCHTRNTRSISQGYQPVRLYWTEAIAVLCRAFSFIASNVGNHRYDWLRRIGCGELLLQNMSSDQFKAWKIKTK